ncbi:MAG: VanW family protein [Clostridia bacterium]|nr:VanW family protein [Clostridia bacterium]
MGKRPVKRNKKLKIFLIVLVFVIILILGLFLSLRNLNVATIADNVYVNDFSVGGMTVDQAEDALNKNYPSDYFGREIEVKYDNSTDEINLLGTVEFDAEKTAKQALEQSNNFFARIFNKEKIVVPMELKKTNEDKIISELILFAIETEDKKVVFKFNDDYTEVSVDASQLTEIMDTQATAKLIYNNAEKGIFEKVDAVVIKNDDEDFIKELSKRLSRPAKNATVKANHDGSTYIVTEEMGIEADENEFAKLFKSQNGRFKMKIKPVKPKVTYKDLDISYYQDVLGSYTSAYNVGLVNRSQNLALAARLVNGTEIMPGKRFSYNSVVGKRTYERGFKDATVYTGEGTEESIGGGICQVSSTIYCAQLRADLKTISRTNHSYTIVYVPLGQDATVVYGSLDYVFENNTDYPIKITAYASGGYLTVKILGTKIDKSKSVEVVSVTESTTAKGETTQETDELPSGVTEVKQNGQNGAVVSTYKIYYKNGVEQKREFIGKSVYKPMDKITLVGTGKSDEAEETMQEDKTDGDTQNITEEKNKYDEKDSENSTDETEESESNPDNSEKYMTSDTGI